MRIDGVKGSGHSHHPEKVSKKLLDVVKRTAEVSGAILNRPSSDRLYSKRSPNNPPDHRVGKLFKKGVARHESR